MNLNRTTILIKLDPKANQLKLIQAIEMFKGVKSITVTCDGEISDQLMAIQMSASRKSGKGNKAEVVKYLDK